jgi:peptidoglycan hydrolase CwlO-like protein
MTSDNVSVQDKLNKVLALLRSQGADIAETKKMLADSQAKVAQLETKVTSLEKEVKRLKESSNDRDLPCGQIYQQRSPCAHHHHLCL